MSTGPGTGVFHPTEPSSSSVVFCPVLLSVGWMNVSDLICCSFEANWFLGGSFRRYPFEMTQKLPPTLLFPWIRSWRVSFKKLCIWWALDYNTIFQIPAFLLIQVATHRSTVPWVTKCFLSHLFLFLYVELPLVYMLLLLKTVWDTSVSISFLFSWKTIKICFHEYLHFIYY